MALNETAAEKFKFWLKEAPSLPPRVRKAGDELIVEAERIQAEKEQLERVVGSVEAVLDASLGGYFTEAQALDEINLVIQSFNRGAANAQA